MNRGKLAAVLLLLLASSAFAGDFERAAEAMRKKDYDLAISLFNTHIRDNPKDADGFYGRGTSYLYKRDYDNAIEDCNVAIRLDPKHAKAHYIRGYSFHLKGNLDRAVEDYNETIRLGQQEYDAYVHRGLIHTLKMDHEAAIRDYDEAIKIAPKRSAGYVGRAIVKQKSKDFNGAIKDYTEAIRAEPNPHAYGGLAGLLATCPKDELRDGKKAIEYATKACELTDWKRPDFLAALALAHAECGNFMEASKWQKKAIELGTNDRTFVEHLHKLLKLFEEGKPYREE